LTLSAIRYRSQNTAVCWIHVTLLLSATFLPSVQAIADTFGTGEQRFEIEFVTVGDPNNSADATGNPQPAGAVGYAYRIGKYEISRDIVAKANAQGNLGITLHTLEVEGDPIDGVEPFEFIPRPGMPATGVSWNEAARFVNWLNTSQGHPPAYKFEKLPGATGYSANAEILLWQAEDEGFNPKNPFRNSGAFYFLPNVDEWYKAAYFDRDASNGSGGYWDFPTQSDVGPVPVDNGNAKGTAVFARPFDQGPADVSQSGGLSAYGTMGQGGNAWEWEETEFDLVNDESSAERGVRGGDWTNNLANLASSDRFSLDTLNEGINVTFRVASIPEPESLLLTKVVALLLLIARPHLAGRCARSKDRFSTHRMPRQRVQR
jgi:formylglycine-generating enzyme